MSNYIYLDNAATTPLCDAAYETIKYALYNRYENPSSMYPQGRQNKKALENCRCQIAELINADPSQIFFTSGGTESDNWAINSIDLKPGDNIIVSLMEHDAVYQPALALIDKGIEVRFVKPQTSGRVTEEEVLELIDDNTKLVSVMTLNNEIGTINPVNMIGEECSELGVKFHTDAVQAFGHIPICLTHIDMLSVSAHKFGGPKGVGFLYVRHPAEIKSFIKGGQQESHMRAGTENLPGIMGMTSAAVEAYKEMDGNYKLIESYSEVLRDMISFHIEDAKINGSALSGYPGIVSVTVPDVQGEQLVEFMAENKICISSGSACHSGDDKPSRVLLAMGYSEEQANSTVRFSLSARNTLDEIMTTVNVLKKGVELIRG